MIKQWKFLTGLCTLILLLAGCSSTQLGYRFLDNLIRWELNDYVSLYGQQSSDINTALDTFHDWHRADQLPAYSQFLTQQIKVLERPSINANQLQQAYDGIMAFWRESARQLVPELATLFSVLDENQLKQLQKNMDKKALEYEQEHIRASVKEQTQYRQERMLEALKKWAGKPNKEQIRLVKQWAAALNFEAAPRLEQRKLTWQHFDNMLKLRKQPQQLQRELTKLMVTPQQNWTPSYRRSLKFNRQKTYQLLITLHASLTDQQKQKLLSKLAGYRKDFIKLWNEN